MAEQEERTKNNSPREKLSTRGAEKAGRASGNDSSYVQIVEAIERQEKHCPFVKAKSAKDRLVADFTAKIKTLTSKDASVENVNGDNGVLVKLGRRKIDFIKKPEPDGRRLCCVRGVMDLLLVPSNIFTVSLDEFDGRTVNIKMKGDQSIPPNQVLLIKLKDVSMAEKFKFTFEGMCEAGRNERGYKDPFGAKSCQTEDEVTTTNQKVLPTTQNEPVNEVGTVQSKIKWYNCAINTNSSRVITWDTLNSGNSETESVHTTLLTEETPRLRMTESVDQTFLARESTFETEKEGTERFKGLMCIFKKIKRTERKLPQMPAIDKKTKEYEKEEHPKAKDPVPAKSTAPQQTPEMPVEETANETNNAIANSALVTTSSPNANESSTPESTVPPAKSE